MKKTFDDIYNKFFRLIKHVAFNIVKDISLAEDICQETFIKMVTKIDTHKVGSNFKYWLIQIAKNTSYDYLRNDKINQVEYNEETMSKPFNDKVSKYDEEDEQKLLNHIKAILDEEAYEIIILRFYYGLKFREIAEILEVSTATVTSKYTRSIKILKKSTKEEKTLWKIKLILSDYEKNMNFQDNKSEIKEKLNITLTPLYKIKRRKVIRRALYALVAVVVVFLISFISFFVGDKARKGNMPTIF